MKSIKINWEVLQNLYGDCQESMSDVFSEFLSSYTETKRNLVAAYESGNLISLRRQLHCNGPSFMYLGMPEVTDIFKKIEVKCNDVDNHYLLAADIANLLNALDESYTVAADEIKYFRKAV
jgi:predicted SnoaL-like aldol condensation-catalyzing enzyme